MSNYSNESSAENTTKKQFSKKSINGIPEVASKFPQHIVELAMIIKNNAEIRRYTALGILNYLSQKGEINGVKKFVSFKYNKFKITVDGLSREYPYTEVFFLNALVAAFSSFSASAQKTIDIFCKNEFKKNISDKINEEEVNNVVALNQQYESNKENSTENIVEVSND